MQRTPICCDHLTRRRTAAKRTASSTDRHADQDLLHGQPQAGDGKRGYCWWAAWGRSARRSGRPGRFLPAWRSLFAEQGRVISARTRNSARRLLSQTLSWALSRSAWLADQVGRLLNSMRMCPAAGGASTPGNNQGGNTERILGMNDSSFRNLRGCLQQLTITAKQRAAAAGQPMPAHFHRFVPSAITDRCISFLQYGSRVPALTQPLPRERELIVLLISLPCGKNTVL